MRVLFGFAVFLFTCGTLQGVQDYEITYPERLHDTRPRRDLSTVIDGGHESSVQYAIKAFTNNWVLDANVNDRVTPQKTLVRQFDADNTEIITQESLDNCHYQGSIRGISESVVALTTCNGLSGVIDDGLETFHIEPHTNYEDTGAHRIYPAKRRKEFGMPEEPDFQEQKMNGNDESLVAKKIKRVRRNVANVGNQYIPYLTTNETRYNEVFFLVDDGIYHRFGNRTKTVVERVVTLCNVLDAIYQRINIRIVMSGIEVWTKGPRFPRNVGDLRLFGKYLREEIDGKIPYDNAQFLSPIAWPGAAGVALVGTMCGGSGSRGVNTWRYAWGSHIGPYIVVAHEMGHNFNFPHSYDKVKCKCLSPKGCVMQYYPAPRVLGFTECSLNGLKRINDRCLYNVPTKAINAKCGNGIREGDEECDCGTPDMCKAKDPCCMPHDCRLKPEALCSDLHHSCCTNCLYKRQGTLCRPVKTDCDVPEYCPGDSRDCPADISLQDGTPCNRTNKLLPGNTNWYSVVTSELSPHIEARYVRINPQYWHNWICMRTELNGCSADEANAAIPTPLKPFNNYCIVPQDQKCIPEENTKVIFKHGYECKEEYMKFRLDTNGTLWHHCSGRRVCPENGNTWNGVRLVISSSCQNEDSKFVRTPKKSLKHVKSGKCIHPIGAWPADGRQLGIWGGCGLQRLEIWFIKPDCIYPLGIQSLKVTNEQMIASSSRPKERPYHARLRTSSYWCAEQSRKSEYLQVNFNKTTRISKVAIQGRSNWYNWVTGYFVYYSQDGQHWTGYSESGDSVHSNSYCFTGKCAETRDTQCRDLWGPKTDSANQACYDKLNTEAKGYGTCDPMTNSSCAAADVLCGQIQCSTNNPRPVVDYGKSYKQIPLADSVASRCSAAVLKTSDMVGQGMVNDGTKCGDQKMCMNSKCQSFKELKITKCPSANELECNGRGRCTSLGTCHCDSGYDPKAACEKVLLPIDGGFTPWTTWSICDKGCDNGKQSRHRYCSNPVPKHGGKDCQGEKKQEQPCNTVSCPKAHSCRHLQMQAISSNLDLPDGIYKIYPHGLSSEPILAYCDMSRDGGGWTLLVTSRTNTWTAENITLKNAMSPSLTRDYSILKYADDIKNDINIAGTTFEYRLEAQTRGRWGGVWQADRSYTFTATTNAQTDVKLVKKFDMWSYADNSIEKRMPWIKGAILTTSKDAHRNYWGTIAGPFKKSHPAPWINQYLTERNPDVIWYWMREGPWQIPRSCMEVQMRGLQISTKKNGVYSIKPPGKKEVKTYCDLTSRGGGWTLLATSKTHTGWTADNVKERNTGNPSLDADYSILGVADAIKDFDVAQDFFQYRIEADGFNQYGGIFDAPRDYTFTSTCDKQTNIKRVESFDEIGKNTNLATRMPRLGMSSDIFLSTGSTAHNASGSIVYNDGSPDAPSYLPSVKPAPGVIRYWMREGTRRSCNDIKIHGIHLTTTYKDGYYMIRLLNDSSYLPVFCDMTSDPGAYTLVVTSRHNSWTRKQVPARNVYHPSLNGDYSILKFADRIKNLSKNTTFKYKLDANERGHWGGVWSAPREYSFMATSSSQTKVTLLQKFDAWSFSWWRSVQNRMSWFNAHANTQKALLTTSSRTTYYPSGSIIWGNNKDFSPAYWIRYGGMQDPGVIWYWVNEDDCNPDRKPVHGGLSEWGARDKCDKLCSNGMQRRYKTCTNPVPKCGGKPCGPSQETDERPCYTCPESPIRS